MKQLLIVNAASDLTLTDLSTGSAVATTAAATNNFAIFLKQSTSTGKTLAPICIPEVDVKSLKATKVSSAAGNVFQAQFPATAITDTTTTHEQTVIFVKKGTVFNERNKWSVNVSVGKGGKTMTAAEVAAEFVEKINAISETLGLTAAIASDTSVVVTASNNSDDFAITFADDLQGYELESATSVADGKYVPASEGVCDADYIKKLYQDCIAGKGVKYLAEDGKDIYPGYPESISGTYTLYNLTFAVGRDSAKTRDEKVTQTVHIAVKSGVTVTGLETILGVA